MSITFFPCRDIFNETLSFCSRSEFNQCQLLFCGSKLLMTDAYYFSQHPYPSEEQKKQLAQDTGLTILQVNNW